MNLGDNAIIREGKPQSTHNKLKKNCRQKCKNVTNANHQSLLKFGPPTQTATFGDTKFAEPASFAGLKKTIKTKPEG